MARQLRKYQQTAREQIWKRLIEDDEPSTLLVMATGCHRAGQKIRLYNGQLIQVENIWPGCLLMGPDSCPRRVLCLCRGRGEMVRILPVKGRSWVVNIDHVLTLVKTPRSATDSRACRRGGDIVDVTVRDWLSWPKSRKHVYKLFRVAVHYPGRNHLPINPYFMGTLLGDGSILARVGITSKDFAVAGELFAQAAAHGLGVASSPAGGKSATFFATNGRDGRQSHPIVDKLRRLEIFGLRCQHKFIPDSYKTASVQERLELLAGVIDTDGSPDCGGYDYSSTSQRLAHDVAEVARSVGLAAYVKSRRTSCQTGAVCLSWRVWISGDVSRIPCRIGFKRHRKRRQKKNVLRTGFSVERLGVEDYYGFTLDCDGRYLLDDFTVTHNTGKTFTVAHTARDFLEAFPGQRILYVSHTEETVRQSANEFRQVCNVPVEIERAAFHATGCGRLFPAPIVCASKDTLCKPRRLRRFNPENFSLLIQDEAHHATSNNHTWQTVLDHFAPAKRLGATATARRGDGLSIKRNFGNIAFHYPIRAARDDGYLVPIVQVLVTVTDYDLSRVRVRDGDFSPEALDLMMRQEKILAGVCDPLMKLACAGGIRRPTLIFSASRNHAKALTRIINRPENQPGQAVTLVGDTVNRESRQPELARFRAGEFQYLSGCQMFTEGFDEPCIRVLGMARPTKRLSLYVQMLGRALRPADEIAAQLSELETPEDRKALIAASEKKAALVVDFVGNASRHDLNVTCLDLLAGSEPEDVRRWVFNEGRASGEPFVVEEAVARAKLAWEEEEAKKRERIIIRTKFETREVDPFDKNKSVAPVAHGIGRMAEEASDKQKAFLRRYCNFSEEGLRRVSKRKAGAIMAAQWKKWRKEGRG